MDEQEATDIASIQPLPATSDTARTRLEIFEAEAQRWTNPHTECVIADEREVLFSYKSSKRYVSDHKP
jgi:hypothetical protein